MKYGQIVRGRFLERPNRFIALAELEGQVEKCHVKNTGRCGELLIPGAEVWLERSANPNRKTAYDLVGVNKNGVMVNMDSQAPNKAVLEWIQKSRDSKLQGADLPITNITYIKPECKYGSSRIDFYVEAGQGEALRRIFIEVKGVTLEEHGVARFPDAPTERGIKHLLELQKAVEEGYEAWVLFVIQMKGVYRFEPNDRTHPQFGDTLRQARRAGVRVLAYDCRVTPEEMELDQPVAVELG